MFDVNTHNIKTTGDRFNECLKAEINPILS